MEFTMQFEPSHVCILESRESRMARMKKGRDMTFRCHQKGVSHSSMGLHSVIAIEYLAIEYLEY